MREYAEYSKSWDTLSQSSICQKTKNKAEQLMKTNLKFMNEFAL